MNNNALALFARFLLTDIVFDVVRFPVWWYTRGAFKTLVWFGEQLTYGLDRLAIPVLLKNLVRPMFGDYTWQGRMISLFVRTGQLIVSLILFVFWTVWHFVLFVAYFLVLPALIWFIIYLWPHG